MLRTVALATLLVFSLAALATDPPKAVTDAIKSLEKAHADSKDTAEKERIADAIAALKKSAESRKTQDHLISDYIDNREAYAGRTLTFRVAYVGGAVGLGRRGGDKRVPFTGEDPKNGAKLNLILEIPADLKLPAAKDGEDVIVTFKVGAKKEPSVAVAITRP